MADETLHLTFDGADDAKQDAAAEAAPPVDPELEANVLLEHPETLAAKTLTMAYRCLPPEQITDDIVRHTLWHLRSELAKPDVWRPIRRYEYLGLGKKKS